MAPAFARSGVPGPARPAARARGAPRAAPVGSGTPSAVTVPARVLDRDDARLAGERHGDRPSRPRQFVGGAPPIDVRARVDLLDRQIAEPKQQIVHAVHACARGGRRGAAEARTRRRRSRPRRAGRAAPRRPAARAAAPDRSTTPARDVRRAAHRRRRGSWRRSQTAARRRKARPRRVDGRDPDLPPLHPAERVDERRHVEDVAQALAIRLEHDREGPESRRDGEQIGRAFAQLPERAAPAGPALGQQQRAAGGLAELGREHRRPAELSQHQRLDLLGRRHHQPRIRRLVGLREPHHEPVVGPHRFDVEPRFGAGAFDDGHRPRGVDAAAERARGRRRASRRARRGSAR